jgi:hypothetical protein
MSSDEKKFFKEFIYDGVNEPPEEEVLVFDNAEDEATAAEMAARDDEIPNWVWFELENSGA